MRATTLLELLAPTRCVVCRGRGELLCGACAAALRPLAPPLCDCCGRPVAHPVARCRECAGRRLGFRSARAAVVLDATAGTVVHAFKSRGLAALGRPLHAAMTAALAPPAADLLVAVPAAADRVRWRGVDAPALLAALLAETWRLPFDRGALARAPGRPQRGLDAAARRRNVRGVFSARHAVGGAVALVDDVYTTGATAAACARELRRAGADSVHVVTFARAVRG